MFPQRNQSYKAQVGLLTRGPTNSRTCLLAVYFHLITRDLGLLNNPEKH